MKVLVAAQYGQTITCQLLSEKAPEVGSEYFLEDAREGTGAQNRTFHLLMRIYFTSGCFSDNATTEKDLKRSFLLRTISWKMEKYAYSDKEGHLHIVMDRQEIPEWIMSDPEEKRHRVVGYAPNPRWSDTKLKERRGIIKVLMAEMVATGVQDPQFEELMKEFHDG